MKTMRVKVIRKFLYDRKVQALDSTPELPAVFALEMIAANKAERIEESAPPAKEKAKGKDGDHAGK